MLALHVTVPVACWRKGHARELLETEPVPSPAMCYGALLSLVGETDRERHCGVRVSGGVIGAPPRSTVVRTLWRVKSRSSPPGVGDNAKPDLQHLLTRCDVMMWLDSGEDRGRHTLEDRIRRAFEHPGELARFGGWSLGESSHLINDAWLLRDGAPPSACTAFLVEAGGALTLPVWVDHVGTAGTRHAVGALRLLREAPCRSRLPIIG